MNTQEQIEKIIENEYNNYQGKFYIRLKMIHSLIREKQGDEKFLKFLLDSKSKNPKPIYKIPENILINANTN